MSDFEQLMNTNDPNQFFIRLCGFLRTGHSIMSLSIHPRKYDSHRSLSLTIDIRSQSYRDERLILQAIHKAHEFILTENGHLDWIIDGEQEPIRGLAEIKRRFQELREVWEDMRVTPPAQLDSEEMRKFLED
jgi:hypothetical protein